MLLQVFLQKNNNATVLIDGNSFYWWASWLNENPEKTVIAPKHWFAKSRQKKTQKS